MSNIQINDNQQKIDPVTALQEGIDGLSLAMFEALRGLRDAATVEDDDMNTADIENFTTVGSTGSTSSTAAGTKTSNGISNDNNTLQQQQQQDAALVQQLVDAVFEKSYAIDAMLDNNYTTNASSVNNNITSTNKKPPLLYTNRTKDQQMEYIQTLITENNMVIQELYAVVQETIQQRDRCRQYIIANSDSIQLQPILYDDDTNETNDDDMLDSITTAVAEENLAAAVATTSTPTTEMER